MDLEKTLKQVGFEEKEAKTYLACLQLGKDNASHIAKRAELKRSTVYLKLNELNLKGLVDIVKTESTTHYKVTHPNRLLQLMEFRKKQIDEISPILTTLYKGDETKPKIQIFEGEVAVGRLYSEFLAEMGKNKMEEIFVFSNVSHFYENSPYKKMLDSFINYVFQNKIEVKEILSEEDFKGDYGRKIAGRKRKNYEFRLVPDGLFMNDNLLFRDKVAIFSIKKNIYATLIEDKEIAKSYRSLFMLAWGQARKPEEN